MLGHQRMTFLGKSVLITAAVVSLSGCGLYSRITGSGTSAAATADTGSVFGNEIAPISQQGQPVFNPNNPYGLSAEALAQMPKLVDATLAELKNSGIELIANAKNVSFEEVIDFYANPTMANFS